MIYVLDLEDFRDGVTENEIDFLDAAYPGRGLEIIILEYYATYIRCIWNNKTSQTQLPVRRVNARTIKYAPNHHPVIYKKHNR